MQNGQALLENGTSVFLPGDILKISLLGNFSVVKLMRVDGNQVVVKDYERDAVITLAAEMLRRAEVSKARSAHEIPNIYLDGLQEANKEELLNDLLVGQNQHTQEAQQVQEEGENMQSQRETVNHQTAPQEFNAAAYQQTQIEQIRLLKNSFDVFSGNFDRYQSQVTAIIDQAVNFVRTLRTTNPRGEIIPVFSEEAILEFKTMLQSEAAIHFGSNMNISSIAAVKPEIPEISLDNFISVFKSQKFFFKMNTNIYNLLSYLEIIGINKMSELLPLLVDFDEDFNITEGGLQNISILLTEFAHLVDRFEQIELSPKHSYILKYKGEKIDNVRFLYNDFRAAKSRNTNLSPSRYNLKFTKNIGGSNINLTVNPQDWLVTSIKLQTENIFEYTGEVEPVKISFVKNERSQIVTISPDIITHKFSLMTDYFGQSKVEFYKDAMIKFIKGVLVLPQVQEIVEHPDFKVDFTGFLTSLEEEEQGENNAA